MFQNTPFKDVRILRWNERGEQNGVVEKQKIKPEN